MKRTQIQIPDHLFEQAARVAGQREISMAELVRRGLEYMISVSQAAPPQEPWTLPNARPLGGRDPFASGDWRADLHLRNAHVAENPSAYKTGIGPARKP